MKSNPLDETANEQKRMHFNLTWPSDYRDHDLASNNNLNLSNLVNNISVCVTLLWMSGIMITLYMSLFSVLSCA